MKGPSNIAFVTLSSGMVMASEEIVMVVAEGGSGSKVLLSDEEVMQKVETGKTPEGLADIFGDA